MMLVKEITKWEGVSRQPNHTYLISEDYSKIFGYFKWDTKDFQMFKKAIRFDSRYRKFKVIKTDLYFKGEKPTNKQWKIAGSKGNVYVVEESANGLTCSCVGFKFHGKCKHIDEVTTR
jgi:hypothetical protein